MEYFSLNNHVLNKKANVITIESHGCEDGYNIYPVLVQIGQGKVSYHLGVFSAPSTNENRSTREIVEFLSRAQVKKLNFC